MAPSMASVYETCGSYGHGARVELNAHVVNLVIGPPRPYLALCLVLQYVHVPHTVHVHFFLLLLVIFSFDRLRRACTESTSAWVQLLCILAQTQCIHMYERITAVRCPVKSSQALASPCLFSVKTRGCIVIFTVPQATESVALPTIKCGH